MDSFVVRSSTRPGARALAEAIEARLRRPLRPIEVADITVSFDNDSLPWHTAVVVAGPDQPGVLQAVAAALAAARVVVHSARIATQDGQVNDRLTVSDRFGRKLDSDAMDRVHRVLRGERVRAGRR